ncbi:MAG: hypothetical protein C0489_05925 [Candidatus Accumulibacter sp.]|nr:hypothetical protein [Accumulibacter sp.]MBA4093610.1 hypothetical protein [Accumulibacter sp.]
MQPASSSIHVRPSPADERAQEEAALWFARMRGERVTELQRAHFAAWLAADEIHRREYEILERIWDQSRQLAPTAKAKADSSRGHLLRNAGGVIGVVLFCAWLGLAWFDGRIATDPGERQHIRLADGSELDVAPRTRLRIKFDASQRRLELDEGRIVVEVAADPQRPFEVIAGGGIIRDIGTRFEVDAHEGSTRVTVAEGIVEIVVPANGEGAFRRLKAGETADLDGKAVSPTQAVDTAASLAWTKGQLVFDSAPLADVISALNRYRKTPVDLDAPTLAGTRISGVFLLDDEASALRALEQVAPIRFLPATGRVVARPIQSGRS